MRKKKNVLPSGNYRLRISIGKDADGVYRYKSFTARTKAEAVALAEEWKASQEKERNTSIRLSEAVERYIELKRNVLSPATIVGYERILKNYVKNMDIGSIPIDDIKSQDVQLWISDLSKTLSPKTVANAWGTVRASIDMFSDGVRLKITLPSKKHTDPYCPSADDIRVLIDAVRKKGDQDLLCGILLAAFGSMRRGEACCVEGKDIEGNIIHVKRAMVLDSNRQWIVKEPKTYSSYRDVVMPDEVMKLLPNRKGRLIRCTPDALSEKFAAMMQTLDLPWFTFHSLRHFYASILHSIGIPDQYIMQFGGWESNVMQRVYRNVISDEEKKHTKVITDYFNQLMA